MKELNQAVYYTTAQVTELVDLSDQNVRKYVRLLEDRKYEVAKDEHNRRLFSANDVLILRELIKKSKKPGYTLESAADEIVNEISEIVSASGHNVSTSSSDNDIKEMFTHVIERLDAIQDENKDLKDNIRNLVERLEQYDEYSAQRYLDYPDKTENNVSDNTRENNVPDDDIKSEEEVNEQINNDKDNGDNNDAEESDNGINKDMDESSDVEVDKGESTIDTAPSVSEASEKNNIDMREYADEEDVEEEQIETDRTENSQSAEKNENNKDGFFNSLFKMFKK